MHITSTTPPNYPNRTMMCSRHEMQLDIQDLGYLQAILSTFVSSRGTILVVCYIGHGLSLISET